VGCIDGSPGLFLKTAMLVVFSFGFFAKAMGQEFHVGRGKISLAFTIHNLTAALFVPLAGRLVDRYGPRKVLVDPWGHPMDVSG
jgi:MFS family permease